MRKLTAVLLAMTLIALFATAVSADTMVENDRYVTGPIATLGAMTDYDPTPAGASWTWPMPPYVTAYPGGPIYPQLLPSNPPALPANNWMVFGMENIYWPTNEKSVYLVIEYTGGELLLDGLGYGYEGKAIHSGGAVLVNEPGRLVIVWPVWPQPDWEWLLVKNVGGAPVTFNSIYFYDECIPVPSLTQWGIIGLVLLMLAAGAMVIVRQRRAPVNA